MTAVSFRKIVIILGVVIGVLAATYAVGMVFSPANVGRREAQAPLVPRFKTDQVGEVRLKTAAGALTLQKKGNSWIVPIQQKEFPASSSRVAALLDFLLTLQRSQLVTANPEAWADFQVDNAAAQRITVLNATGNSLMDLLVGKTDAAEGGTYVRLADSNNVVLVNRMFDYYLNAQGRFWSQLRILPQGVEGGNLTRISVKAAAGLLDPSVAALDYTLLLGEDQNLKWKALNASGSVLSERLEDSKVDRLASSLASLEGTEFAVDVSREQAGLDSPRGEILFSTGDGQDFRLLVGGPAGKEQFYAGLQGGEYIYSLAQWRLEAVFKPLKDLQQSAEGQQQGAQ